MMKWLRALLLVLVTATAVAFASNPFDVRLLPIPKEISLYFALHEVIWSPVHVPAVETAAAPEKASAERFWKELFPGVNEESWFPKFDTPNFDPRNLSGGAKCADSMKQIYTLTDEYGKVALKLDNTRLFQEKSSKTAEALLTEIRNLLSSVKGTSCFEPTVAAYAMASFGPDVRIYQDYVFKASNDQAEGYRALVALLFNRGFIRILTPEVRCELGGIWNSLSEKDKYEIVGGYACEESQIGIDPTLAPYDLRASLIHELDHLMRDKLIAVEDLHVDPATYIVLDEGLSAVHAGLSQIQVLFKAQTYHDVSPPKDDLSFFTYLKSNGEKGNLLSVWSEWMPIDGQSPNFFGQDFLNYPLSWHLSLSFLNQNNISEENMKMLFPGGKNSLLYQLRKNKSRAFQDRTFLDIAEKYNVAVGPEFLESAQKQIQSLGIGLSPLVDWVRFMQPNEQEYASVHRQWIQLAYFNLYQRLHLVSRSCQNFLDASQRGELSGYVGTKPRDQINEAKCATSPNTPAVKGTPKKKNSKPAGGESVRPSGGESVRPGGESVRPSGGESVRPSGGESVRPGLKPCVRVGI